MSERKRMAGLALTVGGGCFLASVATLHVLYGVEGATPNDALKAMALLLAIAVAGALMFLRLARPVADRLEIQHDRLNALLRSVGDGMLILDQRGDVQWANPASQQMHGIAPVQFGRMSIVHLFQGAHDALEDFLASGDPRGVAEVAAVHAGGELTTVEVTFGRSVDLACPLITAIVRDVSARPGAEAVIRQLEENLAPARPACERSGRDLPEPGETAPTR